MSTLEELLEYKRKLEESGLTEQDLNRLSSYIKTDDLKHDDNTPLGANSSQGLENNKTLVKTVPGAPKYSEKETNGIFNQAGFSNAIFLSTMTLICEITFLILSFYIFK